MLNAKDQYLVIAISILFIRCSGVQGDLGSSESSHSCCHGLGHLGMCRGLSSELMEATCPRKDFSLTPLPGSAPHFIKHTSLFICILHSCLPTISSEGMYPFSVLPWWPVDFAVQALHDAFITMNSSWSFYYNCSGKAARSLWPSSWHPVPGMNFSGYLPQLHIIII